MTVKWKMHLFTQCSHPVSVCLQRKLCLVVLFYLLAKKIRLSSVYQCFIQKKLTWGQNDSYWPIDLNPFIKWQNFRLVKTECIRRQLKCGQLEGLVKTEWPGPLTYLNESFKWHVHCLRRMIAINSFKISVSIKKFCSWQIWTDG